MKVNASLIALFIFLLSLTVRLSFVSHVGTEDVDQYEYLDIARHFASGEGPQMCLKWHLLDAAPVRHSAVGERPLGFPLLLSIPIRFVHSNAHHVWLIRATNAVIGSLVCLAAFGLFLQLFNLSVATIAGLLLSLNWAMVKNSSLGMPEQMFMLLLVLGLWTLALSENSQRKNVLVFMGGTVLGFCAWIRMEGAIVLPLVLASMALTRRGRSATVQPLHSFSHMVRFTCGFLLSWLPALLISRSDTQVGGTLAYNFRLLNFPTDSWKLYGETLPGPIEFLRENASSIASLITAKAWGLLKHLFNSLNWLLLLVPLLKAEDFRGRRLSLVVVASGFLGLYSFTWATFPESRYHLIPYAMTLPFLIHGAVRIWERGEKRLPAAAAITLSLVFTVYVPVTARQWWSGSDLVQLTLSSPAWLPQARTAALRWIDTYTDANTVIASDRPWLINGYLHRPALLCPRLRNDQVPEFIEQFQVGAFVFLATGNRTSNDPFGTRLAALGRMKSNGEFAVHDWAKPYLTVARAMQWRRGGRRHLLVILKTHVGTLLASAGGTVGQASRLDPADGLPTTEANPPPQRGKVLLVIVNSITVGDLAGPELRGFHKLMEQGSLGLMNTRSDDSRTPESAFLTIGAGRRARGGAQTQDSFNAEDQLVDATLQPTYLPSMQPLTLNRHSTAAEVYRRRVGIRAPPASVLCLGISDIHARNMTSGYKPTPGLLGKTLRENGIRVAVLGNADASLLRHRAAVAIAMDETGLVPLGDVGIRFNRPSTSDPFGIRTNFGELREAVHEYLQRADFLVIETGDTARADEYSAVAFDARSANHKKRALQRVDAFLSSLLPSLDRNRDLLMVIAPNAATAAAKLGNRLTPTIVWGKGFSRGIVRSAATRTDGLVTSLDIAPTICKFFGIVAPSTFVGRPIERGVGSAGHDVFELDARSTTGEIIRKAATNPSVYFQVTFFFFTLAILLYGSRQHTRFLLPVGGWLCISIPIASLAIGTVGSVLLGVGLLFAVSMLVIPFAVARRFGNAGALLTASLGIWLFAFTLLTIDHTAFAFAFIGHSLSEGARFYGIGNEYGGILIACSLVAAGVLMWQGNPRPYFLPIGLFFCMMIFFIGFPGLGANFGDMLAAIAGFGTFLLAATNRRVSAKTALIIIATILMLAVAMVVIDKLISRSQASHGGQIVESVRTQGPGVLLETFARKLEVNWRLIKGTKWTVLAISAMLLVLYFWKKLPWFFYAPNLRDFPPPLPEPAMLGLAVAFLVELVLNDSGIVGAALMASYAAASLLILFLDSKDEALRARSVSE